VRSGPIAVGLPSGLLNPDAGTGPTEVVHRGVPDLRSGGMRLLGWAVLVILLVAGGGALLLALDSERRSDATAPAAAPAASAEAERAAGGAAEAGAAEGKGPARQPRGRERKGRGEKSRAERAERAERPEGEGGEEEERPAAPRTVPKNDKEAEALLAEAKTLRDNLEWNRAKSNYQLVVQGKFHRGAGYLGLAEVAFQQKRLDDVIALAKRGGNGVRARVLLGHAYFQKGDYETALKYYDSVLKQDVNHAEAQSAAKAARERLNR
jgi:tetratricopeptide (TPR) repeat protein